MRVSWICWLMLGVPVAGAGQKFARPAPCRWVVVEGEVTAGHGFERAFGGGLKVGLEPVAEGWAIRVVPEKTARGEHDYAELATPPYRSLSPLMVSTGLGFRAQDAVGWNPRRFHFAANVGAYTMLLALYDRYLASPTPSAAEEANLAEKVHESPEGTLQIVDARLIPGTANQVPVAGSVASHFGTTAHTIDQPSNGLSSELGRLEWIRFRFLLTLASGMTPAAGLKIISAPCDAS